MRPITILAILAILALAAPAVAQDTAPQETMTEETKAPGTDAQDAMATCTASIHGTAEQIAYREGLVPERSTIDRWLGRGAGEGCPPEAVLAWLTPTLTPEDRAPFCLVTDPETQTVTGFSQGERAGDLTCAAEASARPGLCERVNQSAEAAQRMAGIDAEAGLMENAGNVAGRVQAFRDSSGATIVTGAAGALSGVLGSMGATGLSALTAPAAVGAATVAVVAAGGAVYVCR